MSNPVPASHAPSDAPSNAPRPWLSVILPVYRGEEWLDRTLGSVVPDADVVVMHKLMIEGNEREYLRRANYFDRQTDPFW